MQTIKSVASETIETGRAGSLTGAAALQRLSSFCLGMLMLQEEFTGLAGAAVTQLP